MFGGNRVVPCEQKDGHDGANGHFSQFFANAPRLD